jgi:hypothetical protein
MVLSVCFDMKVPQPNRQEELAHQEIGQTQKTLYVAHHYKSCCQRNPKSESTGASRSLRYLCSLQRRSDSSFARHTSTAGHQKSNAFEVNGCVISPLSVHRSVPGCVN